MPLILRWWHACQNLNALMLRDHIPWRNEDCKASSSEELFLGHKNKTFLYRIFLQLSIKCFYREITIMAYLMASGRWRYEGWTDLCRSVEKNQKRLDCFQASVDFLSVAILLG